jgi:ribosomal protein S18 acetylase RimI-like enzyme
MKIISPQEITPFISPLTQLLINCVDKDSSIGFIEPLSNEEALRYWNTVNEELSTEGKLIFLATKGEEILGCVQLSLAIKANALHRAEVEKLMVNRNSRGQGVAKKLMQALENAAMVKKRSLLVLDTRKGDIASNLYKRLGYIIGGEIPNFAQNSEGKLESTLYFYKVL